MKNTFKPTQGFITKQRKRIEELNNDIVDFELLLQNEHAVDIVGTEQFELMIEQLKIMKDYRDILIYRLTRLNVGEDLV